MRDINIELYSRLEKLITSMGYELVGCELQPQGHHLTFRIYIDGPSGVTVEDCSKVSHQISAMLDVEDPFKTRYILEVSSPGINRPLFTLAHYQKFIGKRIKLRLHIPVANQRNYTGLLTAVVNDSVTFKAEGSNEEITVAFDMIEKANLIGEINSLKTKVND